MTEADLYQPPVKPLKKASVPPNRRRAEKAAAREAMPDKDVFDAGTGLPLTEDEDAAMRKQVLANTVSTRIRDAKAARESSGIEYLWDDDDDQYNGIDDVSVTGYQGRKAESVGNGRGKTQADGRSKVFLNITKPKTQAGVARVKEMLLPTDDKPWSIENSPIPELSDGAEADPERQIALADGNTAPAKDVVAVVLEKARKSAEKMGTWIEDKFVEGDVYAQMRLVVEDAGRIGTGVIKGPYAVARKNRKWTTDEASGITSLQVHMRNEPTSRRIDPRDAFPDPSCGENIHNGSYFVERDYLTGRQLRDLAMVDGYDANAIIAALKEGPTTRGRDRDRARRGDRVGETTNDSEVFEVYYYYGDCTPEDLALMGQEMSEKEMQLMGIPAIVTMLNDRPIKAIVNPMETGEFPYDFFPWEPVAGQVWGRGIPFKMAAAQKILNAGVRRLLENAGLSAGAQIAITEGVLTPVDGRYEIVGRKLWKFKPTAEMNDITKAMAVFTIPSVQQELSAIIQFALQMADELTNLPQLLQGQNNREGQNAAPETFGGMTMLLNSANAPLRVIAKQFDDYLVVRHLRRYYDWGMQSPTCPKDAKGDHQIKALGSTVMVQREAGRELLPQLWPIADDPQSDLSKPKLLVELARSYGYIIAQVQLSDDEKKQRDEAMANQPPPQDPRIEAAKLTAETKRAQMEIDIREAELDRAHESALKDLDFQIQAFEFAGQKEISLEQLRAMLATKAIENRTKRDEMALKLSPGNRSGTGI